MPVHTPVPRSSPVHGSTGREARRGVAPVRGVLALVASLLPAGCGEASPRVQPPPDVPTVTDVAPLDAAPPDVPSADAGSENFALHFEGSSRQVVDFGDVAALNGVAAYSIQCWVRFDALGDYDTVFAKRLSDGDRATVLQSELTAGRLGVSVGLDYRISPARTVTLRSWHHVVLVFDGAQPREDRLRLYVDGAPKALPTTPIDGPRVTSSSPSRFTVGAEYNGQGPISGSSPLAVPFTGDVDELALWGVALDAAAVAALYHGGTPLDASRADGAYSAAGLESYWRFDDGTGTTVSDALGRNPGVIVNGATWTRSVP